MTAYAGLLRQDIPYSSNGTLGVARTWPQAAGALPRADSDFDWQGDAPLRLPIEDLVIYEMHVRGFTQHDSSGVSAPGRMHTESITAGVACLPLATPCWGCAQQLCRMSMCRMSTSMLNNLHQRSCVSPLPLDCDSPSLMLDFRCHAFSDRCDFDRNVHGRH